MATTASFVKFSRGLISTYENLRRKDPDTLYLVYENATSTTGKLYLGDKLISSVISKEVNKISDLEDVVLPDIIEDGALLQYNASSGNGIWEAVSLSELVSKPVQVKEDLSQIINPQKDDIVIVNNNAYIYNGNTWNRITNSSLSSRIEQLEQKVGSPQSGNEPATGLYADLITLQNNFSNYYTKQEIANEIANAQHLKFRIVNNLNDININDTNNTNTIFLVPKDIAQLNNGYDEYFIIDNALEKIGEWSIDLSNYITQDDNRLLTDEQKLKLDSLSIEDNTVTFSGVINASHVSGLADAIRATELIKSVQSGVFTVTNLGELQLNSIPSNLLNEPLIKSVDTGTFEVVDGKLYLKDISAPVIGDYVTTTVFNNTVGNLSLLNNRVSEDSTLVEEINQIKDSLIWKNIPTDN